MVRFKKQINLNPHLFKKIIIDLTIIFLFGAFDIRLKSAKSFGVRCVNDSWYTSMTSKRTYIEPNNINAR